MRPKKEAKLAIEAKQVDYKMTKAEKSAKKVDLGRYHRQPTIFGLQLFACVDMIPCRVRAGVWQVDCSREIKVEGAEQAAADDIK